MRKGGKERERERYYSKWYHTDVPIDATDIYVAFNDSANTTEHWWTTVVQRDLVQPSQGGRHS